jgi:hypothetical protein
MSEHRLNEVVIERPRHGMRISLKKQCGYRKQLHKLTQEASEDGLFRPYLIKPRNKSKYFSDHLNPLQRYLRSKVGQPWNDIYSELCQRLDSKTMTGRHVISHIWNYVERHVELYNGIPYSKASWGKVQPLTNYYREHLYVHPETGILCLLAKSRSPAKARQGSSAPTDQRLVLDCDHEYHQLDGVWYLITFADLPNSLFGSVFDVLQGPTFCGYRYQSDQKKRYAAHKRRCNKQEIRTILRRISQQ